MNLTGLVADCARASLAEGRCSVADVAERVERLHGDVITAAGQDLIRQRVREIVKRQLRDLSQDEDAERGQGVLPDLKLPSAIAVRPPDEPIYYVRTDMATWAEVLAGLEEREQNIERAVTRRNQYESAINRLRPFMANDPTCTVAEALRREAASRSLVEATR